jgi:hypothetical protein
MITETQLSLDATPNDKNIMAADWQDSTEPTGSEDSVQDNPLGNQPQIYNLVTSACRLLCLTHLTRNLNYYVIVWGGKYTHSRPWFSILNPNICFEWVFTSG